MSNKELLLKEIESIPDSLTVELLKFIQSWKEIPKVKSDFFTGKKNLDALAVEQNIKPVERLENLYGDFWPDNESTDDFINQVRKWRDEG